MIIQKKIKIKESWSIMLFIHINVIISIIYMFALISALGHCTNYILERSVQKAFFIGTRFSTKKEKEKKKRGFFGTTWTWYL